MIKFFRQIRYNLMEQNKTGKYFKYAIGEIVLVVIGILIAISINNWNERRKLLTSEQKLLIELLTDLEITREELEVDINYITNTINLGVNILQVVNNKDNLDQRELERLLDGGIPGGFLANSGLFPRTIAYQNLKSLGFEKFSNDTIRYLTADIFDRKLVRIKDWELIIYQSEEKLYDIINKNFKLVASNDISIKDKLTPISYSNFKNNRVLINGFANMQNSRRFVRNLYLELKVSIDELITFINIELNKE